MSTLRGFQEDVLNSKFSFFAFSFMMLIKTTPSLILIWSGFIAEIDDSSGKPLTSDRALTANWSTVAKWAGKRTANKPDAPGGPSPLIWPAVLRPEAISFLSNLKIFSFIL